VAAVPFGTGRPGYNKIVIRCPTFDREVPTGLTTESIKFDSLSGIKLSLHCPACLKRHSWEKKDAWVAKDE